MGWWEVFLICFSPGYRLGVEVDGGHLEACSEFRWKFPEPAAGAQSARRHPVEGAHRRIVIGKPAGFQFMGEQQHAPRATRCHRRIVEHRPLVLVSRPPFE